MRQRGIRIVKILNTLKKFPIRIERRIILYASVLGVNVFFRKVQCARRWISLAFRNFWLRVIQIFRAPLKLAASRIRSFTCQKPLFAVAAGITPLYIFWRINPWNFRDSSVVQKFSFNRSFFRICKRTRYSNHIYFFRPDTRFLFIKEVSTRLFSKKILVFF